MCIEWLIFVGGVVNLSPQGQTTYNQTTLYATHAVEGYLKPGDNALGVELGNGWCDTGSLHRVHRLYVAWLWV